MSRRVIRCLALLAGLAALGGCSLLPGSKPAAAPAPAADAAAPAAKPDAAAGVDYVQRPSDDNRKALAELHAALDGLMKDPNLGHRAPEAMQRAAQAVAEADKLQSSADRPPSFTDVVTGDAKPYAVDVRPLAHLIYIADRRVQTARALAEASFYEDEAADLKAQLPKR